MMRRAVILSLLGWMMLAGGPVELLAAGGPQSSVLPGFAGRLPAAAVAGSTPERRAAWESLSSEEQEKKLAEFRERIGPAVHAAWQERTAAPRPERSVPGAGDGKVRSNPAAGAGMAGRPLAFSRGTVPGAGVPTPLAAIDQDGDGLDDVFESQLADFFTPVYHVSAGERSGTGFARFGDFVPETVVQNLPPLPPVSHFRVTPQAVANVNGVPSLFLRIDYLTLWNRDDGLDVGGACRADLAFTLGLIGLGTSFILDGLANHPLDNERSAVLVAAPLGSETNPAAYSAYDFYLAAHEGTFTDHSIFLAPSQPVPAGNHINLGLSRQKHATYEFNPNGFPLLPSWVIASTYAAIDGLYFSGFIDDFDYLIYLAIADGAFFACFVERFSEQGGAFSATRINVGEVGRPINGSGFIHDSQLQPKLTTPLWIF